MAFLSNFPKALPVLALAAVLSLNLTNPQSAEASYSWEQEPNNDLPDSAQNIDDWFSLEWDEDIWRSTEVPHASIWGEGFAECIDVDTCTDEFDFYSFTIPQGIKSVLSVFDIDRTTAGLDTRLFLFDRLPDLTLLDSNDDALADFGGTGSIAGCSIYDPKFSCDSFLTYKLRKPGTYFLGVNFIPPYSDSASKVQGKYTLHVSLEAKTVPEPASVLGLLGVTAFSALSLRKRQQAKQAS